MKALFLGLVLIAATFVPAKAEVMVDISLARQEMSVLVDGVVTYDNWKVSTARKGMVTPEGVYPVERLAANYWSSKYHSPMPHSVFFDVAGGFAIHATEYVDKLGTPASHGCVRLDPENAAALFELISQHGMADAIVVIHR